MVSNARGTLAYAFKDPNGRTTQVFINLRDNAATHDAEPFVPFARIIKGLEVADALYAEYGEKAGGGIRGGRSGWRRGHGPSRNDHGLRWLTRT